MPLIDLPLAELERYSAISRPPADLRQFWTRTLDEAREHPVAVEAVPYDNRLTLVDTWDVSFGGFGGQRVSAWLHTPAGARGPLPTVIRYHGYSGGRGLAHQEQLYALAGYAHLVMDVRGQGWSMHGDTPDAGADAGRSTVPGFLTRGIEHPDSHYYRRLFTDAVRMVDAARELPVVDAARIVVTGGSQGGALALAAAALADDVAGAIINVPFLSDIRRALMVTGADPYGELVRYLARYPGEESRAYETLSYFDVSGLAPFATAPALFSVALQDLITPPSTVYAAFNAYGGPDKTMVVYPYNGHEGGGVLHEGVGLDWLAAH